MPTLTLRDVPQALHAWLKRQASAHRRSVNQEAIALLEAVRGTLPERASKLHADELLEIGRRCAGLPELDARSADEIIGYDEHGIPR
jgi:antitoxin VapB